MLNLGARLEALTKPCEMAAAILVCGETVAALTKPVPMRQVDLLRVKGQEAPTAVYEDIFIDEDASRRCGEPVKPSTQLSVFIARCYFAQTAGAAFDESAASYPR